MIKRSKLFAWLTIVTLLLNLWPAGGLATDVSEVYSAAGTDSTSPAITAVENAIANNLTAPFVSITDMIVDPASTAIRTGESYHYIIYYEFKPAPTYKLHEDDAISYPCYTQYDSVTVTVTPPANVELSAAGLSYNAGTGAYTFTLSNQDVRGGGIAATLNLSARMTDNGSGPHDYAALAVQATATVTVADTGETRTFPQDKVPVFNNHTAVRNSATGTWGLLKTLDSTQPTLDTDLNEATFHYTLEAGLLDAGSAMLRTSAAYNTTGALKLTAFALSDVLPTFTGASGATVSPLRWSITPVDADGNELPAEAIANPATQIAYYNTLQGTGNAGGRTVSGSETEGITLPNFTRYHVSVTYPLAELTAPWKSTVLYTLTNAASLALTTADGTAQSAQASVQHTYARPTESGYVKILQYLRVNGQNAPYDAIYHYFFPGVTYELYHAADFDTVTGQPNAGATAVLTLTPEDVQTVSGELEPGGYVLWQAQAPADRNTSTALAVVDAAGADAPRWQALQVPSGTTPVEASFYNIVVGQGLLKLLKTKADGTPLANVLFTLSADAQTYTGTTGTDGIAFLMAPEGDYTLTETVPDGYIRAPQQAVHITAAQTLDLTDTPIVNVSNAAQMTLTAYSVAYRRADRTYAQGEATLLNAVTGVTTTQFPFTLLYSTDPTFQTGVTTRTLTLPAGQATLTVSDLPRTADGVQPYYYQLTQGNCADPAFTPDPYADTWTFETAATHSAAFYAQLHSKLTVLKKVKTLKASAVGTDETVGKDYSFTLYTVDAGVATAVATVTTGTDGKATTDYLPIQDANGPITYYLVEGPHDGYTVQYPSQSDITVEGATVSAWPVTLSVAKSTDRSTTPVYNLQNKWQLLLRKRQAPSGTINLAGAKIAVYTETTPGDVATRTYVLNGSQSSETNPFVTTTGTVLVNGLSVGVPYYVKEISAPDGYRTDANPPIQTYTVTTPLSNTTATFYDNKKPTLTVTKQVKDPITGSLSAYTGSFGFSLYRWNSTTSTMDLINAYASLDFGNVSSKSTAAMVVEVNGDAYYVAETAYPTDIIPPYILNTDSNNKVIGNVLYVKVPTLSDNLAKTVTLTNNRNIGKLTLNTKNKKTNLDLPGATYTVAVTTADATAQALLAGKGFTAGTAGLYTLQVDMTTLATADLTGLPVYASDGNLLTYTITQTTAPEGFRLPDEPAAQSTTLRGTTLYTASLTFLNAPYATLTALKLYQKAWESKNNDVLYPLPGATLALYLVTADGKLAKVNGTESPTGQTDANGQLLFSELDGTRTYMAVELTPPEGYDLPTGKTAVTAYDDLLGLSTAAVAAAHNAASYNLNTVANNSYIVDLAEALRNSKPYTQFRITKVSTADGTTLLDGAKFQLYSCTQAAVDAHPDLTGPALFTALQNDGALTVENYTYETGTALKSDGTQAHGVFDSNPQEYGLVYWFKETAAPEGYTVQTDLNPYGPYTAASCVKNGTLALTYQNTPQGGGSGDSPLRHFQFELNKKLYNESGVFLGNLAGVTFAVYLADADFQPRGNALTHFTTGLDTANANYPSVAGRGVSETLEFSALYANSAYTGLITRTDAPAGSGYLYDYSANFVLKETVYPANVAPDRLENCVTLSTAGHAERTVVDRTYTGDASIRNVKAQKVPVRVRKLGYPVPLSGSSTLTPLAGATIGIYSDEACTTLITSGVTDDLGYAHFTLLPSTRYWYREDQAPAQYDLNPTPSNFLTSGYASEPVTDPQGPTLKDPAYRVLKLIKTDMDGVQQGNVRLQAVRADTLGKIKDTNGVAYPDGADVLTTAADAPTPLALPYDINGAYTLQELSIGGQNVSAWDQLNFRLANLKAGTLPINFAADEAERTVTVLNPDKAAFLLTKTDDAGQPMANVAFAVQFKSFALADLETSVTAPAANTGWNTLATWTTDAAGQIAKTGLTAGWYRLTETLPDGYVEPASRTLVVKMTARGLGQSDTATVQRTVVNVRKGTLRIDKQFEGDLLEAVPSAVQFAVYTDEACTVPAAVPTVTVPISGGAGSQTAMLDPGVYYLSEATGAWYGQYSLAGGATTWLTGPVRVTLTSDHTAAAPLTLAVVNRPSLATLTLRKLDDNGNPVTGARFALYYLKNSQKLYYHADTRLWTADATGCATCVTGTDGQATLRVTLPLDRLMASPDATAYYLTETEAPPELKFAPDRELTLSQAANSADLTADPLVDATGLYIDLTQYGRNHAHATATDTLAGGEYTLYIWDGTTAVPQVAFAAGADGSLRFANLEKLSGNRMYAVAQTGVPSGCVPGLVELYLNGTAVTPIVTSVQGVSRSLFVLTQAQTVAAQAYNTPTGAIAVLKYNYLEPTSSARTDVPYYAVFSLQSVDDAGNVIATISDSVIVSAAESGDPATLPGGYTRDAATGLYTDADGAYYTVRLTRGLAPGRYRVQETSQAEYFYYTPHSVPEDPWYPVRTLTVDDNGGVAVCAIANIPKPEAPKLQIDKTVYSVNGRQGATQVPSLQAGWQTVVYRISGFARTPAGDPIQLPTDWLEVSDQELEFRDAGGNLLTDVAHYTLSVTVGKAYYEATPLNPSPVQEVLYASVYGVTAAGAETLVATRNVSDTAQKVSFPENTYAGFRVRYGVTNGGGGIAGLKAGFTTDPILAEMRFAQDDAATVVPARSFRNKAAVRLQYSLGGVDSLASSWTLDVAQIDTEPEPSMPHMRLTMTADKLNVKPQDVVTYTLTLENVSTDGAALIDPVLLDRMPAVLEYSLANVTWAALPTGLTADVPVTNGEYLYVKFHGSLAQGKKIVLYVQATVRTVAEATATFVNTGYFTSTNLTYRNVANPTGTAYLDAAGSLPDEVNALAGSVFGGQAETYLTLVSPLESTMTFDAKVTLYKMASANHTGLDVYSGSEGYAIATGSEGEANIQYKLVLRNDGLQTIEHIRLVDKLPRIGDTMLGGSILRDSRWPVAFTGLLGVSDANGSLLGNCTVYTTTVDETPNGASSNYLDGIKTGDTTGWTTAGSAYATAKAVRIDFDDSVKLAPGERITLTLSCTGPTAAEADAGSAANTAHYYFWLNHNTAAVAVNLENYAVRSVAESAQANVLLNPALLTLGNRVWVDRNANGLQDVGDASEDLENPDTVFTVEPSLTQASQPHFTLRTFVGSDVGYTTQSATPGGKGFYAFDNLFPSRIKDSAQSSAYDAAGNVYNSALFGVRPTSYQLVATDIPAGYLVTRAFANNGGTYAPNLDHDTLAKMRNDSNFRLQNGAYVSERFYLRIGTPNPTLDLGLLRYRNLSLTKYGTDGNLLDGAVFKVYGPFTDAQLLTAISLDGRTPVATLTTSSGAAQFQSTDANSFLNYYRNYVVVETTPAAACYPSAQLTAAGDHVAPAATYPAVTGGGIADGNYFVLTARDDADSGPLADSVTVTDRYEASGALQVTGLKTQVGGTLAAGQYSFTLTGLDDPDFTSETVQNDAAGNIVFSAIPYTYADAGHTYRYTVAEVDAGAAGITYDAQVYTVTAAIVDLGAGTLGVTKTLTDAQGQTRTAITFQNSSKGTLRLTKALAGNAGQAADSFTFTVTLRDGSDQPVSGTYPCVHSGDAALTALAFNTAGEATVTLRGGENLAVSGLLTGTHYAVAEADARTGGYLTASDSATGEIRTDAAVNDVLFTNTRNVGNLTVSKTLAGTAPDTAKRFRFEIALSHTQLPVNGTYPCAAAGGSTLTSLTFTLGKATVELTGGQSVTVQGLYAGTTYTVTEADYAADAYVPTPSGRTLSGTIAAGGTATAPFANRRDATTLTVTKALGGNAADAAKAFAITVTLSATGGVDVNRTYPCAAGSALAQVAFTGGKATVSLKGGQFVTLTDVPVGVTYAVSEASYAADGYTTTYLPDADPHTLTQAGGSVTVVNTRNTYGALVVTKTLAGAAVDPDKEFDMALTLQRSDTLTVDGTYACERVVTASGATTSETLSVSGGVAHFSLKGGESLSVAGILTGTVYTVTEADYRGDGYFPTPTDGVQTGVIYSPDQSYTAPFVNTRGAGKLIVSNTVQGNAADPQKQFRYTVRLTRTDGVNLDGPYAATLRENGADTPVTLTLKNGTLTFTLRHGQAMTIPSILKNTHYQVVEDVYTLDGYTTQPASRDISGDLTADQQVCTADFLNIRNVGELIVEKALAGNGASTAQSFSFTVTLSRTDAIPYNLTYACELIEGAARTAQTLTFSGGTARLSLRGGQRWSIQGIPADTAYAVAEDGYTAEGYITASTGATGAITPSYKLATFTNTRTTGTLTLTKTLRGNAVEPTRAFTFTVRLLDRDGRGVSGTYAASGAATAVTFTGGVGTVQLRGGESVTLQRLLTGWSYTVTEVEANANGYTTTSTGTAGLIRTTAATAAFVNERNSTESYTRMTVTKRWSDSDDHDGLRPKSVTIYLLNGTTVVASQQVSSANNWTCVFDRLPVFDASGAAIVYTVSESPVSKYYAQIGYGVESADILNTHTVEVFRRISKSNLLVLMDYEVPLGGNINLNEGDCFN
ncbi:MAG: SpaA isopeptide-forming pilin-related protein [Candidatus Limiplasma sp.]|nr:SpaA isopeptide-forming pilin-related protein [Candidatus Limiplasma sp.]